LFGLTKLSNIARLYRTFAESSRCRELWYGAGCRRYFRRRCIAGAVGWRTHPSAAEENCMTAVELTDVHLAYSEDNQVLTGANLQLAVGEILGLLGASGSGESTVSLLVAGLHHPSPGSVAIPGTSTVHHPRQTPPPSRDCTMVFQVPQLFPHRSVAANLSHGLEAAKVPAAHRRGRVG